MFYIIFSQVTHSVNECAFHCQKHSFFRIDDNCLKLFASVYIRPNIFMIVELHRRSYSNVPGIYAHLVSYKFVTICISSIIWPKPILY